MNTKKATILLCFLLLSYSTRPVLGEKSGKLPPRYKVSIEDQPDRKRFAVKLISFDDRPLCLGMEQWPNKLGQLDTGSQQARLESDQGTYHARDENFGYCIGPACILHVAPHSSLTGFINYREFGVPAKIAALSRRQLYFPVTVWVCNASDIRGKER